MTVQCIFKRVYRVHVHHMARKAIPIIHNPVCKEKNDKHNAELQRADPGTKVTG